jgi:hypothetical protein
MCRNGKGQQDDETRDEQPFHTRRFTGAAAQA